MTTAIDTKIKPTHPTLKLASDVEDVLRYLTSPPRIVAHLGRLGVDARLCGHGVCVQQHGYLYRGDGEWTLLWPTADPIVGHGGCGARIAKLVEVARG